MQAKKMARFGSGMMSDGLKPRPVLAPVTLTKEQNNVLQAVLQGQSLFFTGSAGTGKSFLLRRIIGMYALS